MYEVERNAQVFSFLGYRIEDTDIPMSPPAVLKLLFLGAPGMARSALTGAISVTVVVTG